jgi:DNA helicase TIP49 (TBP-interacting protein)
VQILAIRAQVEEVEIDEESLAFLGEIGQQTSLRYDSYIVLWYYTHTLVQMHNRVECWLTCFKYESSIIRV